MKILVTGGAGFIASHIVDAYIALGHDVAVVDNLSTGREENINPKASFYKLDICSEQVKELILEQKPDIINHHAAQIDVRRSVQDPAYDAKINIVASLNILEAARQVSTKHFIFSSTGGAIYGEQDYFPADEAHPLRPLSPYGVAKLSVEKYLDYYRAIYGLPYTIFRYANVYGPRQNPKGEAGVVAIFCELLSKTSTPTINGDGLQTRDYVYVADLVKANCLAIEHLDKSANQIFNIGTGIETDVNSIFQHLKHLFASEVDETHGSAKAGEQRRSVLSSALVSQVLGWRVETSLEEGLEKTVAFYKK
ncbi:MAG: NAD-dependent epimerase/dehydratase family protein [Blastocatellia bacterium]|nr:NAD-dependent epimerase/dehydratase family protein [Blastocatellia bacterium]